MAEPRTYYAHAADVIRKYNPQLTITNVTSNDYIGSPDDLDRITSRIEEVEGEFEELTNHPFRAVRVGHPDRPATWVSDDADMYRYQGGVKVWLNHREIVPLNASTGDTLELRTGRDSWKDITAQEGNKWVANYEKGWIKFLSRTRTWTHGTQKDRFFRVTYRHGAPGGDSTHAGQTTLDGSISGTATSVTVTDAAQLPPRGVLFVDGSEYVRIESISGNTLTVEREVRGTEAASHSDGATVHYCPMNVRSAVAAKAAIELLRYEDWVDELIEGGGYSVQDKMSDWTDEWEQTIRRYAEARPV